MRLVNIVYQIPYKFPSVNISGIWRLMGIFFIGVIVDLSNLISTVQHGDSGQKQHIGMKHYIHLNGSPHGCLILLKASLFHTAHRCCSSTEPGVSSNQIFIIKLSPADAVKQLACKVVIQILFVRYLLHSPLFQKWIVQTPANIIMTS